MSLSCFLATPHTYPIRCQSIARKRPCRSCLDSRPLATAAAGRESIFQSHPALGSYCHWLSSDLDLDLPKNLHRSMRSNKTAETKVLATAFLFVCETSSSCRKWKMLPSTNLLLRLRKGLICACGSALRVRSGVLAPWTLDSHSNPHVHFTSYSTSLHQLQPPSPFNNHPPCTNPNFSPGPTSLP